MPIDEAIKHAEELADYDCYNEKQLKCAEEYRQLAEWLEDYKRLLGATESIRAEIEELPIDYVNVYDGPNRLGEMEFICRDEVLEILGKYEEVQK